MVGKTGVGQDAVNALHQRFSALLHGVQHAVGDQLQGGVGGGGAYRVGAIGAAMGSASRSHAVHEFLLAADGGDGESVAHGLGIGDQVAVHAKVLLGATRRDAEPGLDFVHDHDDAILVAQRADMLQPAGLGHGARHVAHDRLDDDGRHVAPCLLDRALQRFEIVVGQRQHQLVDRFGDA